MQSFLHWKMFTIRRPHSELVLELVTESRFLLSTVTAHKAELLQSQDCQPRDANTQYIFPSKYMHQSKKYPSGVWRDSAVSARPFSPGVTYTQIPEKILGSSYYLLPKLCSRKPQFSSFFQTSETPHFFTRKTQCFHTQRLSFCFLPNAPEHRSWDLQGLSRGWASPPCRSCCSRRSSCAMAVLNSNICSKGHQRFFTLQQRTRTLCFSHLCWSNSPCRQLAERKIDQHGCISPATEIVVLLKSQMLLWLRFIKASF